MLANLPTNRSLIKIVIRVWFGLPIYFIHKYFLRGMLWAGTYGFALSISSAMGRWLKDVKHYDILMKKNKKK